MILKFSEIFFESKFLSEVQNSDKYVKNYFLDKYVEIF